MPTPRAPRPLLAALAGAALLASGAARGEEPPPVDPPAKLRGGFTAGLVSGTGLAGFSGYPRNPSKIGHERFYTSTGPSPATTTEIWLGGAITDWFVFGVGFHNTVMPVVFLFDHENATSNGILFHVEVFPLIAWGGYFHDLGVMVDAGAGAATVTTRSSPSKTLVDGGLASYLGGGV